MAASNTVDTRQQVLDEFQCNLRVFIEINHQKSLYSDCIILILISGYIRQQIETNYCPKELRILFRDYYKVRSIFKMNYNPLVPYRWYDERKYDTITNEVKYDMLPPFISNTRFKNQDFFVP